MPAHPDPFHLMRLGGIEDARAGRLRFVGAAADRIQEDYLRILRLFRFYAWYGKTAIDDDTLVYRIEFHAVSPGDARSEQ